MRFPKIVFAILAAIVIGPDVTAVASIDIERHTLDVRVMPSDSVAVVSAGLRLTGIDGTPTVVLLLSSRSVIDEVRTVQAADTLPVEWNAIGTDSVQLSLPEAMQTGDTLELVFDYKFTLPPGTFERIYLDRGYRWYPMLLDDISYCRMRVHAPREYLVFGPGDQTHAPDDAADWYEYQTLIPVFKIPLVLVRDADYSDADTAVGEVRIRVITCDSSHVNTEAVLQEAAGAFSYLETHYGRYPHGQLTLVEMPDFPGTNIASGLLLLGSETLRQSGPGQFEGLDLALAMQWFGAGLFGRFMDKGFWFTSLSLPHAVRSIYDADRYGRDTVKSMLNSRFERYRTFAGTDVDVALADIDLPNTAERGIVLYAKGPYVLDLAQDRLGKDDWMRFLNRLYRDYGGRILTLDEFFRILAEVDPSDRTTTWLRKQVSSKGIPTD